MAEPLPPLDELVSLGTVSKTGSCQNCGFLCHKNEQQPEFSQYREFTDHSRQWHKYFGLQRPDVIWCYRDEPILGEIETALGRRPGIFIQTQELVDEHNAAAFSVITKRDRECDKWFPHKSGRSPEEHLRLLEMKELEEMRLANALKINEVQRQAQERNAEIMQIQAGILKRIETNERASGEQSGRYNRAFVLLALLGILLAATQLIIAVVDLVNGAGVQSVSIVTPPPITRTSQSTPDTATSQPQPTS